MDPRELTGARSADPRFLGGIEEDVRLEIEAHLAMRTEDNIAAGMNPAAARRDAEQRFGDVEAIARACEKNWSGGRTMLQRIHVVVSIALAATLVWMLAENRKLEAVGAASRMMAEERAAHLQAAEDELRAKYEPAGDLVFRVGDRVELRGINNMVEVVQRDGNLLLPDIGWFHVAGRARSEVEAELMKKYKDLSGEDLPLNLVVVESPTGQ